MNWGYKILVVYLVFITGVAVLVYKSSVQKIDLVTTNYYEKELQYQDRIDAIKKTKGLSSKLAYQVNENSMAITLPAEFNAREAKGQAVLYCPADIKKDIIKDFSTTNRSVIVAIPANYSGSFQLQVSWVSDGHEYYFAENVFL